MSLPKMKNCRIDYKEINGETYSLLVDYTNNNVLFTSNKCVKSIKNLYSDFKYMALNMSISLWTPFNNVEIFKIDGVNYKN